jgi:hypothetical protein
MFVGLIELKRDCKLLFGDFLTFLLFLFIQTFFQNFGVVLERRCHSKVELESRKLPHVRACVRVRVCEDLWENLFDMLREWVCECAHEK